ncbi:MAG: chemotaxis protein CheW [Polyangiales bacterium]
MSSSAGQAARLAADVRQQLGEVVASASRTLLLCERALGVGECIASADVAALGRDARALRELTPMVDCDDSLPQAVAALDALVAPLLSGAAGLDAARLDLLSLAVECAAAALGEGVQAAELEALLPRLLQGTQALTGVVPAAASRQRPSTSLDAELWQSLDAAARAEVRQAHDAGRSVWRVHVWVPATALEACLDQTRRVVAAYGQWLRAVPRTDAAQAGQVQLTVVCFCDQGVEVLVQALRQATLSVRAAAAFDITAQLRAEAALPVGCSLTSVRQTPAAATQAALPHGQVPVDATRLDALLQLATELHASQRHLADIAQALAQTASLPTQTAGLQAQLHRVEAAVDRNLRIMRQEILDARLQPIEVLLGEMSRFAVQLAQAQGCSLQVAQQGGETRLDKVVLRHLREAMRVLLRHAVQVLVAAAGLGPEGSMLALRVEQRGARVQVEVELVGREWVAAASEAMPAAAPMSALGSGSEASLLSPEAAAGDAQQRAVLDVVRAHLAPLGGVLQVRTHAPERSVVQLVVPVTLATAQLLLVQAGGQRFAVPVSMVQELLRTPQLPVTAIGEHHVAHLRGRMLPVFDLAQTLTLKPSAVPAAFAVVVRAAGQVAVMQIDAVHGPSDLVVKPLGSNLAHLSNFSGAALLEDGTLAFVLDVYALIAGATSQRMTLGPGEPV